MSPVVHSGVLGWALGAGFASVLLALVVFLLWFFLSAWISGLWLRLMVRLHRSWFDREYARMRGQYVPPRPSRRSPGPRDWGGQGPTFFS